MSFYCIIYNFFMKFYIYVKISYLNIDFREVFYLNKIDISKILKLSLGSSLAIFIAYFFQLQYAMVAGVITLLVVKDTKKETIKGALGKLLGFILCTLYSYLCFNFLGYNLWSFSLYILIIISTCFVLDMLLPCV